MSLVSDTYKGLLESALIQEIEDIVTVKMFHEGEVIIEIGQYIRFMPLLLKGAVKIVREDANEGELLLYYLEKGDTCTMSIACCAGNKKSEIRAIAEVETSIAMVPNQYFNEWLARYASWRSFILESYSTRMGEMLSAIDSLAFSNMEQRIMQYLNNQALLRNQRILKLTHNDIALDLNTSRVVVSRLLKKLERQNKIVLLRNEIRMLL